MSSNKRINKTCHLCGAKFIAKTDFTLYCGDNCAKKAYKKRSRRLLPSEINSALSIEHKPLKDISKLEYLTPTDASKLMQCSRVYIYELMNNGKLPYSPLSKKKRLISRIDIDSYLESIKETKNRIAPGPRPFDLINSFSMGEARQHYNISERSLYDLIKRENIEKKQIGKFVYVEKRELDKYLSK